MKKPIVWTIGSITILLAASLAISRIMKEGETKVLVAKYKDEIKIKPGIEKEKRDLKTIAAKSDTTIYLHLTPLTELEKQFEEEKSGQLQAELKLSEKNVRASHMVDKANASGLSPSERQNLAQELRRQTAMRMVLAQRILDEQL